MTNWEGPEMIARVFDAAKVLMWLSGGAVFYHDLTFMAFDLSVLLGRRARRWPQIFYFGVKIFWWIYFFLNVGLVYSIKKPGNCQIIVDTVEVLMGLICTFASVLLACRTVCVYSGKTRTIISGVLTVGILGVFVTWMAGAGDVAATWVPKGGNPWQEGACNYDSVKPAYSAKYVITVAYDLMVLVLTVVGVLRMQGTSRLGSILMSQGFAYFSMTAVAYLVVAVLCLLQLSPVMTQIGAVPSSAIAVLASTKLYYDLAEAARPSHSSNSNVNQVDSSQYSNGAGEKLASYLRRSKFGGTSSNPSTPAKNTFDNLPYSVNRSKDNGSEHNQDSISDLESQSNGTGKRGQGDLDLTLTLNQHPYAAAASGLPILPPESPSGSSPSHGRSLSNVVTSGQKLAIAVERSCEVRSEEVPNNLNFVTPVEHSEEEYANLKRQSS